MSFFQNTCKPSGLGGRLMVKMMNSGHAKLADWGFSQIQAKADARVLDAGCGGGANVAVWLKQCPKGRVTGMDYSEISVAETRKNQRRGHQSGSVRRGAGQRGGHAVSG